MGKTGWAYDVINMSHWNRVQKINLVEKIQNACF